MAKHKNQNTVLDDGEERMQKINSILFKTSVFNWIKKQANSQGIGMDEFVSLFIEDGYLGWNMPSDESNIDVRMFWNDVTLKRRANRRRYVMRAAAIYKDEPTEDNASALAKQCNLAGMSYDEVIERVNNDPFSSIAKYEVEESTLGQCAKWLTLFLNEHGNSAPVSVIRMAGSIKGFSESIVKQARSTINSYTEFEYRIDTRHESPGWVWHLVKKEHEAEDSIPVDDYPTSGGRRR